MSSPAARTSSPSAAVLFPFPCPVFTMSNPCRASRGGTAGAGSGRAGASPADSGCLITRISVTRSAASMSADGACRPVTTTCVPFGRPASAAITAGVSSHPQVIGSVSSSRMSTSYSPFAMTASHCAHPAIASASSSVSSSRPGARPAPSARISTPSRRAVRCSPWSAMFFTNWSIPTRIPRPAARSMTPSAAVVFPFPSPVLTMRSPWRCSRGGTRYGPGRFCFGTGAWRPPVRAGRSCGASGPVRGRSSCSVIGVRLT